MKGTDAAVLAQLGDRLARYRLRVDRTQAQLAKEAGVSLRTLARLEAGESTQLTNLVRVLRALDLLGELDDALPMPGPSPMEQVRDQGRDRQRASGKSGRRAPSLPWRWGDEEETQ